MSGRLQSWHKTSRSSFVIASFATSFHRITSKNRTVYYHIYTKAGAIVSNITLYSNDQSISFARHPTQAGDTDYKDHQPV